jgi:nitrile hydratase beta subunit
MSYTSHADLGGQLGHGAIFSHGPPEAEGELWHADWEPRALALTLAMGAAGAWNIDQSRAARETLADYAGLSYYHVWLAGLQRLLLERGLVNADELAAGHALHPALPLPRLLAAAEVAAALAKGSATNRQTTRAPRFALGDRVRTSALQPDHHTRLPAYARNQVGTVDRRHGTHVFADANAQGLGEQPQWLYSVVLQGTDLWPECSDPTLRVSVDAWESYLQAEPGGAAKPGTNPSRKKP